MQTGLEKLSQMRRGDQRNAMRVFDAKIKTEIEKAQAIISGEYLGGTRAIMEFSDTVLPAIGRQLEKAVEDLEAFSKSGTDEDVPIYTGQFGATKERSPESDRRAKDRMLRRVMGLVSQYAKIVNEMKRIVPPHPLEADRSDAPAPKSFIDARGGTVNLNATPDAPIEIDASEDFEKYAAEEKTEEA